MTNIKDYVDGMAIIEGSAVRTDCPVCKGKNTFTAMREGGKVLYNCYKAGCSVKGGRFSSAMTAEEIRFWSKLSKFKREQKANLWDIPEHVVVPRDEHQLFWDFFDRWQLQGTAMYYDVKDQRAVFPIYKEGRLIDAVGRALGGKQPKWLRYTGEADYYLAAKPNGYANIAVVVEDVISAITVSSVMYEGAGVAILGTSLTDKHMEVLSNYNKVIIALDPDALTKAVEFKKEVVAWTGLPTYVMNPVDDIKYRREEDMEWLINMQL